MASDQGMNLTRAAYVGRLTIKFGALFIVLMIIGRFALTAGVRLWAELNPKPPPPPTVGFGVLPQIRFAAQGAQDKPLNYQLDIPQSRFPTFPDRARVFLMLRSSIGLFTDQRAKEIAADYGYVFAPTVLSETMYRWTKSTPLQSTLEMDIVDLTFEIRTNYMSRADLLTNANLPTKDDGVRLVKSFIGSGQPLPSDLATSSGEIRYLRSVGGELEEAIAVSDADFVQIDIRRAPVDGDKKFYTPQGDYGAAHAILSGVLTGRDQIVEMTFNYQSMDYAQRHTYPLRSVQSALQIVQAGEAYVANKGLSDTAIITSIELGYYDDDQKQDYMQPIYVFRGDGGFLAYVPAIAPQWLLPPNGQTTSSQE